MHYGNAIDHARHYARRTNRDAWLIVQWTMEFHSMSTYTARQWLRGKLHAAVMAARIEQAAQKVERAAVIQERAK